MKFKYDFSKDSAKMCFVLDNPTFWKKKFQDFLMTSRRETEGKIGRP